MKVFEAIVLMSRMMPFQTKLLPNYKIDWGYTEEEESIEKRNQNTIYIYEEKF